MFRIVHKVGLPYSITLFGASPVLPFLFTLYCCSYGLTIFWEISLDIVKVSTICGYFSAASGKVSTICGYFLDAPEKVSTICGYFLDAPGKISTRYSILIIAV